MPYILVRSSPNVNHDRDVCRVVGEAYRETTTHIDNNFQWSNDELEGLRRWLHPLTVSIGRSRLSTSLPPPEVLTKLKDVGFSVVAANTIGKTTSWTLQGDIPVIKVRVGNTEAHIESNFRSTPAATEILSSWLYPLRILDDESLLPTQDQPGEVLNRLKALGFSVAEENNGVWTLKAVPKQIFVRNKMNMETVRIPGDDVPHPRYGAVEAYRNARTYIDSSFQWSRREMAFLDSKQGLGPLTRDRFDCLLSTPRPPLEVLYKLHRFLGFSDVAENTVGVTTVRTLGR
ncbi:uncharacterized protein LOC111337822 [Stylophora pistillata]|uniref:uncharacterized protein LOC111337822 n=1 Tax=Stylophora pistillata TaxID=50429 RepID=UPI000C048670|nr:uncharacterized protein LOC111337822 [Stylophora pistillata]